MWLRFWDRTKRPSKSSGSNPHLSKVDLLVFHDKIVLRRVSFKRQTLLRFICIVAVLLIPEGQTRTFTATAVQRVLAGRDSVDDESSAGILNRMRALCLPEKVDGVKCVDPSTRTIITVRMLNTLEDPWKQMWNNCQQLSSVNWTIEYSCCRFFMK